MKRVDNITRTSPYCNKPLHIPVCHERQISRGRRYLERTVGKSLRGTSQARSELCGHCGTRTSYPAFWKPKPEGSPVCRNVMLKPAWANVRKCDKLEERLSSKKHSFNAVVVRTSARLFFNYYFLWLKYRLSRLPSDNGHLWIWRHFRQTCFLLWEFNVHFTDECCNIVLSNRALMEILLKLLQNNSKPF